MVNLETFWKWANGFLTNFATSAIYLQIDPLTEVDLHYGPETLPQLHLGPKNLTLALTRSLEEGHGLGKVSN